MAYRYTTNVIFEPEWYSNDIWEVLRARRPVDQKRLGRGHFSNLDAPSGLKSSGSHTCDPYRTTYVSPTKQTPVTYQRRPAVSNSICTVVKLVTTLHSQV